MILSEKEALHFQHPIAVPGMGVSAQEKLKEARILVVGAGGLGSPVMQYLSASGIGVIGIADYGVINDEDMHRQPVYQMQDVRKHKAKMAASRLWAVNPYTKHYPILVQVKPETIGMMLVGFDLVIDCSQHTPTHLVLNDACIVHNKPFITGEVHNWQAWWGGFNMPLADGTTSASYRCALPLTETYRNFDAGAIGATHGATGMQIVCETLKYLLGVTGDIAGKLYGVDYLHNQRQVHDLVPDAEVLAATRAHGILTADDYGLEIVPDVED
ncbi:HesA/MoeB/ThiF family protein [Chitinophaga nivalis]|uniref:HesA/MoeB/ThiF family protein n=1 Tax=Chitinophaga nivalis TaxID=2991709 RepID=A0ABT3ISY3_9BACT|nr:HesA/MoeB/ThiF family protein [Chitinophaga nivalis]MCW3463213.1 HesA/MoeB/ThiF family protein [Chitinophaga nivalis]MCW3487097.1 HesA/MoeB/ThiF family protein [Chitinophaga nivalis]